MGRSPAMNLFKVIASGKKSFSEEQASAVLAWLLNPQMEHGLGYAFLARFIRALQGGDQLTALANKLTTRLRDDDEHDDNLVCLLEDMVPDAYIDIVFQLFNCWVLAIENKIYEGSVENGQLIREYNGLCQKDAYSDCHKALIYLVPCAEVLPPKTEKEYNSLKPTDIQTGDIKRLVTWQKSSVIDSATGAEAPSIVGLLEEMLREEATGRIEPLPEYTRHTLKAFIMFINAGFSGYMYEPKARTGGHNQNTEGIKTYSGLLHEKFQYVGVQGGLARILQMDVDVLRSRTFQVSNRDVLKGARNWLTYAVFMEAARWRLHGSDVPQIPWEDITLPAQTLYALAQSTGTDHLYIGIKGGINALAALTSGEIQDKRWQLVRSDKRPSYQWLTMKEYLKTITENHLL